jgi:SecD/SecF fusion protein
MKNSKIRGMIIALVILVTLYFFAPLVIPNLPGFWTSKELKLGLDLQGGSQIQLEVDYEDLELSDKEKQDAVKTALEIIRNRIDQFGVSEPSIQPVGENRILIQLPGLKDPKRAKELIGKTALLEFKLVAKNDRVVSVYEELDKYLAENIDSYEYLKEFDEPTEELVADVFDDTEEKVEEDEEEIEEYTNVFSSLTTFDGLPMVIEYKHIPTFKKLLKDKNFTDNVPSGLVLAVGKEDKNDPYKERRVYILHEKAELTGDYLKESRVGIGGGYDPSTSGKPQIELEFTKAGAKRFGTVTGQNIQRQLAIVLDNIVYSTPVIQDKIPGGEAVINGSFTIDEAQDLVIILNAGNLPAPVNIIEERTVGPTLGEDSIKAGILAAIIGMSIVVLFMIIYYGLSGLIADIALAVNILFILAILAMFEATLTLPGIAGMILTIGMAVDANVLIFERIREELKAGKTPRSAVDSGFSRATITILDANITTLITALVLYQFGTGPLKGFAVTLSIGIVGSMFASIILVRAIFDGFVTNTNRNKLSV